MRDYLKGEKVDEKDIFPLRPCPLGAVNPYDIKKLKNKRLKKNKTKGDILLWNDLK